MIFNINSTRGQTRFPVTCVARVTCLVGVICPTRFAMVLFLVSFFGSSTKSTVEV